MPVLPAFFVFLCFYCILLRSPYSLLSSPYLSPPPRTVSSQASLWLFVLRENHHVGNQATCRVATYYYIHQVCVCVCVCMCASVHVCVGLTGSSDNTRQTASIIAVWNLLTHGRGPTLVSCRAIIWLCTHTRTHALKESFSPPRTQPVPFCSDAHIPTHLHHAVLLYKT